MGEEELPELLLIDEQSDVVPLAGVVEQAYAGAPEGSGILSGGDNPVFAMRLAVLLRPTVPMRQLVAAGPVAALATLAAFEELGVPSEAIGIAWPHDVVLDGTKLRGSSVPSGTELRGSSVPFSGESPYRMLARISTKAGYAEGMFVVLGLDIDFAALSSLQTYQRQGQSQTQTQSKMQSQPQAETKPQFQLQTQPQTQSRLQPHNQSAGSTARSTELARALQQHLVAAMRQWEARVSLPNAQAGPWAPFLQEYFDRVPLLGQAVNVCYPNGRVYARGVFVGIDIWGRATVRTRRAGDIEFPPEKFRIEPQSY